MLVVIGTSVGTPATTVHAQHTITDTTLAMGADDPVDTEPPADTVNPFFPDQQNVTDCIGLVERPGCGSESRGGWHQYLVAIAVGVGLLLVFGRVGWGVWQSQQRYKEDENR